MRTWWRNLSIAKKLTGLVGVMAFLIAFELMSMLLTMNILSAVRSFVGGEGLWSKAQKDAVQNLHNYAFTGDGRYYKEFQDTLQVNLGDHAARIEMIKENPDLEIVRAGFQKGRIHPNDIDGLVWLFRRFQWVSYIHHATEVWTAADMGLTDLIKAGENLDRAIQARPQNSRAINVALSELNDLNPKLTQLEDDFSYTLGEGSRWLEGLLKYLLTLTVLTVECTGLFLTISFARSLTRNLTDLAELAGKVGEGDFSRKIRVESTDELGLLGAAINKMTDDLKKNIGEKQQAENANNIKTLFLANMSHEIRTPLWVILGMTEALRQPGLGERERQEFLETIERTGHDLTRIVNDLLDISKIEANHMEIELSRFNLQDFISDLQITLAKQIEKNHNRLIIEESVDSDCDVVTDRLRVRQILLNLIGNALKFTKHGTVHLGYKVEGSQVHFRVTDTGLGISEENGRELFKPFSQIDPSTTRKFGGTGLGLFLSRRLANMLHGDLVLEGSQIGVGSTFHLNIEADVFRSQVLTNPAKPLIPDLPAQTNSPVHSSGELRGKKVLVVDDAPDNRTLFQYFLKKWGVDVSFAENGQEGVQKALAEPFDLVLMDMQMPILDGYEATKRLRHLGYTRPIVAVTAHAMKEDRDHCLEVGCNDYVSKPIQSERLYRLIKDVVTV